ncbi:hypothetical protein FHX37_2694 [Haloactinospora alba]|uniref:Uncharacterized protein n=1 Tax=Haloactinospora alba TaxID=405555 RepID=A0A543NLM5_9ACTN|nr:hypothetical protein FHX37_2694 [Haloactinospora alba]
MGAVPATPSRVRYTVSSVVHSLLYARFHRASGSRYSGIRNSGTENTRNLSELR